MKVEINNKVLLESLIQIHSHQRATTKLLIELLSKDEQHAEDLNLAMNFFLKEETNAVFEDLYTRHGIIDFRNLLGE